MMKNIQRKEKRENCIKKNKEEYKEPEK